MTIDLVINRLISELNAKSIRYELHQFTSGAIMLDIWFKGEFYVVQYDGECIGLSRIDENTGFDTIPDEEYKDAAQFMRRINQLIIA